MRRKKRRKVKRKVKWPVTIRITMEPKGQARARAFAFRSRKTRKWRASVHKDAKNATYESIIGGAMKGQMIAAGVHEPLEGPIMVVAIAVFEKPKSHLRARNSETWERALHISKPDSDNILKAIKDAGNGLIWKDDSQVVPFGPIKIYGAKTWDHKIVEGAQLIIKVRPVDYDFLRKRIERLVGPDPTGIGDA